MTQLIPRRTFFFNPDHTNVRVSPCGTFIAYIAPFEDVLNIWVAPRERMAEARPISFDKGRGIRSFTWAYTGEHILYTQDKDGDENWRLYSLHVSTQKLQDCTPYENVQARIEAFSPKFPDEVIISLNKRNPEYFDLYRLNLTSGESTLLYENDHFAGFMVDDTFAVRFGFIMQSDGGNLIQKRVDGQWEDYMTIDHEDVLTTSPISFTHDHQGFYMIDSRGRDTAALFLVDIITQKAHLLCEDPQSDINDVLCHPTTKEYQGASSYYFKKKWQFADPAVAQDIEAIRQKTDGDIEIVSRTLDDHIWIIAATLDQTGTLYYVFERPSQTLTFLFNSRKALENLKLCKMHPVEIQTRDHLKLVSYLTLPRDYDKDQTGTTTHPIPLILSVHGGPQARDYWGYDAYHQWLANRGYAVLSVNYRGSTGFGKNFINAGNGEWSRKMHTDLLDAVNWAIKKGIADPKKVAITGGSYGGYATLVGLTFTPDVFACGVDIVGPSNLKTLLESIPPYWKPVVDLLKIRLGGDPATPEGQKELADRSPLFKHENICKPLLIGQGANDPRVKQAESDQIVDAMKKRGIPVTYILYPNEGHGFARPENRLSFFALMEGFLAENLGGVYEPVGKDFEGSSHQILAGSESPHCSAAV